MTRLPKPRNHSENTTCPAAIALTAVPCDARINKPFQLNPPPSLGAPKRFMSSPATGSRSEPFNWKKADPIETQPAFRYSLRCALPLSPFVPALGFLRSSPAARRVPARLARGLLRHQPIQALDQLGQAALVTLAGWKFHVAAAGFVPTVFASPVRAHACLPATSLFGLTSRLQLRQLGCFFGGLPAASQPAWPDRRASASIDACCARDRCAR